MSDYIARLFNSKVFLGGVWSTKGVIIEFPHSTTPVMAPSFALMSLVVPVGYNYMIFDMILLQVCL